MAKTLKNNRPAIQQRSDAAVVRNQKNQLQVLPHAKDIEEAILGACILDSSGFHKVKNVFSDPSVFYFEENQIIWKAFLRISKENKPVDSLNLAEMIKRNKKEILDKHFGGHKKCILYIMDLCDRVTSAANIVSWAQQLYAYYMRRVMIREGQIMQEKARNLSKDIFKSFEDSYSKLKKTDPCSILTIQTVNQSAVQGAKDPEQKQMVGNLLRERDLAIFFSDEGNGKSILSYQIGDKISKGQTLFENSDGIFDNKCGEKKVIIFDFELLRREIFSRYSDDKTGNHYQFSDNFFRVSVNETWSDVENMADKITNNIEAITKEHKPDFIIIDNITWICEESTDNAIAGKIMKKLDALRKQADNLTILVIGHAPKRDTSLPLESKNLAGASALKNFATNLIGMSESKLDPGFKYLKHLKCRGGTKHLTADNVAVMQISKNGNMLQFEHTGFSVEKEHLSLMDMDLNKIEINQFIFELVEKGYSYRNVGKELLKEKGVEMSKQTIMRRYKERQKQQVNF